MRYSIRNYAVNMKRGRAARQKSISEQQVALSCASKIVTNSTSDSSSEEENSSTSNEDFDDDHTDAARPILQDERFKDELLELYKDHRSMYSHWSRQLSNGFNIILHGVGSKRKLLEDYRKHSLIGEAQFVINGPSCSTQQLLMTFNEILQQKKGGFKSQMEHCRSVCHSLTKGNGPARLIIIVHNIEGLQNDTGQQFLALLAKCPNVHMLASVDHVNCALLWDHNLLSQFNWLWYDCTTFASYYDDVSTEVMLKSQEDPSHTLESVTNVISTLTINAQKIFELIARQQLDQSKPNIVVQQCYRLCRERFLVSSEQALSAQLSEFKDHRLIALVRTKDGSQELHITLNNGLLKQFLDLHHS